MEFPVVGSVSDCARLSGRLDILFGRTEGLLIADITPSRRCTRRGDLAALCSFIAVAAYFERSFRDSTGQTGQPSTAIVVTHCGSSRIV